MIKEQYFPGPVVGSWYAQRVVLKIGKITIFGKKELLPYHPMRKGGVVIDHQRIASQ